MKTIGLLGGMSWESTSLYYRLINEETRRIRGGLSSAPIAMVSVDFQEIETLQSAGQWHEAGTFLAGKARQVEAAGADFLLMCTNTMHKVADQVAASVRIPLLHIGDATARHIKAAGINRLGLLGTGFTMDERFLINRLEEYGLGVVVPCPTDREIIHGIIYKELCQGNIRQSSREKFLHIIEKLVDSGAEGVVEGCTEIVMLVEPQHTDIPLFDTTRIHAQAAVAEAMKVID